MKKQTIISLGLIGIGIILIGISSTFFKGDFSVYNSKNISYEEKTYECSSKITSIEVDESSNSIIVTAGNKDYPYIEYMERANYLEYEISEEKGVLSVKRKRDIRNNISFGIDFTDTSFHVYLPKDYNGDLSVSTSSGSINLSEINAKNIDLNSSSGSIHSEDINGNTILSHSSSGSQRFSDIDAASLTCETTSGSQRLSNVSADSVLCDASSGSTHLENVASDSVSIDTTSGSIRFQNLKADQIYILATSGSISGSIDGKESDYSISSSVTSGSCNLNDRNSGSKELKVKATSGSINISFED